MQNMLLDLRANFVNNQRVGAVSRKAPMIEASKLSLSKKTSMAIDQSSGNRTERSLSFSSLISGSRQRQKNGQSRNDVTEGSKAKAL
jgi:hypothetical protein